ncbi:hypothetical protein BJ170DRAFT_602268 [Xylariales sp. AK1849]|nr:hypothetical protein BJ170DRAFT_602268 [Xylariales sp. AK1849]
MTDTVQLADQYRQIYRAQFKADVAAGEKTPFFFHLCALGIHVIPALYLAIPHKQRPWLYRARWLVLAVTTSFHIWMSRNVTSANFAFGYGTGLLAAWGIVWNFTILVWTRPQWDAKRVERFRNERFEGFPDSNENSAQSGVNAMKAHIAKASSGHALSSGIASDVSGNGHIVNEQPSGTSTATYSTLPEDSGQISIGDANAGLKERQRTRGSSLPKSLTEEDGETRQIVRESITKDSQREDCNRTDLESAVDLNKAARAQEYVYEWQEYPEDAPFLTRLDWAVDIASTLRCTGWNWAIPVLPSYHPPSWVPKDRKLFQLPLHSIPWYSRQGYTRARTRRQLFVERMVSTMIPAYIIVDICAVSMMEDPYFIIGPSDLPLPDYLSKLHPTVLSVRRTLFCFGGIISALHLAFTLGALCCAYLGPPILGFRADPWHLPTFYGSFERVLDRGLTGFWGSWWHQTFRFGFSAPTKWMIQNGYIEKGSVSASIVGALWAFVQSGFLHGMASYTTVPKTKPWNPPIFFFLAGVGTQLQYTLARALKGPIEKTPQWLRRAVNLLFVVVWLHMISGFLMDDFGRCGIWLWEPVPFSFVRWLGFGMPGDYWWRWDRDSVPRWYTGKHWWDTGIGM